VSSCGTYKTSDPDAKGSRLLIGTRKSVSAAKQIKDRTDWCGPVVTIRRGEGMTGGIVMARARRRPKIGLPFMEARES